MQDYRQKELLSFRKTISVFDSQKSNLKKYQEITVGDRSLLSLLKYELIITTFGWIPCALGFVLRKLFYPHLFSPKLTNVVFGKNVDIFNPNNIKIGTRCLIGDNCFLEALKGGHISIRDNVSIGRGTAVRSGLGSIEIGENTAIASYCNILAISTKVRLGRDVQIGANSYIIGDPGYDSTSLDNPMQYQPLADGKGIFIEDDVWLGAGVYVLDGTCIGTGSVIGAGSVVTKDIPKYSIAVGAPARVIKTRK